MTASSLYNIVDSIFIGQGVGPYAISGFAITFPFMNLAAAFGSLIGVGASTLSSVLLGQRDYDNARKVLGNVVVLNFIIGGLFTILSLAFLDPILYFFGASDNTITYAKEYMVIILAGNIVTHMYLGLNALLRSSGHPKQAMSATMLTVVLNCILDPIFIFVFDMGIAGAAWATVLSQMVALIWLLRIFSNKEELIHFQRGIFRLQKKIVMDSLAIGLAPFLMNSVSCFVVIFINRQLLKYGGDLSVGAYGIVNRYVFLFMMIVMGFTQGMQPIAGYNYGARQYDRVKEVLMRTIKWAMLIMTTSFVVGQLIPRTVVSAFTSDPDLIEKAAHGVRIIVLAFPVIGINLVTSNFFQSIGKPKRSIFLSLSRQLIFLTPLLYILPTFMGEKGVWWSFAISDIISTVVACLLLYQFFKTFNHEQTA
ncbi:MAG: MATE family efflux transporter [Bacteroidales bacterium]|nr:MATE family efflux transporter [Bacteroidales bacterium]